SVSSESKNEKRGKRGKKESKKKPQTKRQKSFVWDHFTIINKDPNNQRAACNTVGWIMLLIQKEMRLVH
ncbi:LOW QUALITY PROTEIN: hypothetical protein PanWU01x14_210970, partial [Parasponia andersonii]